MTQYRAAHCASWDTAHNQIPNPDAMGIVDPHLPLSLLQYCLCFDAGLQCIWRHKQGWRTRVPLHVRAFAALVHAELTPKLPTCCQLIITPALSHSAHSAPLDQHRPAQPGPSQASQPAVLCLLNGQIKHSQLHIAEL